MQLTGLHHVTAITAQAARNLEFYTKVLGLRLVKKTVNQDDVSAYHLFYADAAGSPGTDVTFFDWSQIQKNRNGAGSIARIALRVSGPEALAWWAHRLTETGAANSGVIEEDGRPQVQFQDPEGQELALIDDATAPGGVPGGTPWDRAPVPAEMGIRGLYGVKLMVRDLEPTARVLTEVLGFERVRASRLGGNGNGKAAAGQASVTVFALGDGGPGREVHVEAGPHLAPGRQGYGGVHHVAFRTPNDEEHLAWRQRLASAGLGVTPVIDRFYFKSIYFRIPGGILFEIATDGPGFAADEDKEHLGERLALPPFLEPHRAAIEAGLRPLETAGAANRRNS